MKDDLQSHPRPPLTPEERAQAVATLRAFQRPVNGGPLAWASKLRFRELSGERLSAYQRNAWREALGGRHSAQESNTAYESKT